MSKLLLFLLALIVAGCSQVTKEPEVDLEPAVAQEELYHSHYVIYPGETLGIISAWYSGTPNNWQLISTANNELDPGKVQLGQQIKIPTSIISITSQLLKNL